MERPAASACNEYRSAWRVALQCYTFVKTLTDPATHFAATRDVRTGKRRDCNMPRVSYFSAFVTRFEVTTVSWQSRSLSFAFSQERPAGTAAAVGRIPTTADCRGSRLRGLSGRQPSAAGLRKLCRMRCRVVLTAPPFDFKVATEKHLCSVRYGSGLVKSIVYGLS